MTAPVPNAPTTTTGSTGSPSATPRPTPSPTPTDPRPRWPLTGRLVDRASDARHAAVAVKVPDNQWEHPQRGIDAADIVFVELEGYLDAQGYSSTRLVPVFHSELPGSVAPVRSVRPVDVPLLSPMDAIVGNTGGSKWVINYAEHHRAHLEVGLSYLATQGTGSYGTDPSRVYTLNGQTYYDRATICHPKVLARQTTRFRSGPPAPYFPFATGTQRPSTDEGQAARGLEVPYKGNGYRMGYRWDASKKRYLRSMPWGPHVLADGTRVSCDNVLVIKVHQHFGKIFRGGGHDEPLEDVIDTQGAFVYLHGGKSVRGTWRKGAIADRFRFTLADGSPLLMAPGQTFVELPDTKAKITLTA
ncbi:hypothetical protein FHX74_000631 [Friedmanniella endophytica]|uniref:DUF3048 domain-containing protein n=1 Tax=Microlunatus kandeliicorticis TaxID=1759536 RepID=A0A7W3IPT9_9ACTN|nr:DUF3048 domain-containing protein [Microlunatus kandeliicorticis]MBA8793037.1 hypothetical protein [Microlunatus kandeliicorticis]